MERRNNEKVTGIGRFEILVQMCNCQDLIRTTTNGEKKLET